MPLLKELRWKSVRYSAKLIHIKIFWKIGHRSMRVLADFEDHPAGVNVTDLEREKINGCKKKAHQVQSRTNEGETRQKQGMNNRRQP